MGDRGNIVIDFNGEKLWFYAHWAGSDLPTILRDALARKQRWSDPPYLARIIFSEMTKSDKGSETGYGISLGMCDNEHAILVVHTEDERVSLCKEDLTEVMDWTFSEFAALTNEQCVQLGNYSRRGEAPEND